MINVVIEEAIKHAEDYFKSNFKIRKAIDYGDMYMLIIDTKKFIPAICVNKKTGKVYSFNPLVNDLTAEQLKNAKQVSIK